MNTDPVGITLLLGSFLFLIVLRVPIVFALGISSILTGLYLDIPLLVVLQNMVGGINVFVLLAIPFFILAGEIMSQGGIARRLVDMARVFVGFARGGLAMVNILASMFFGGISGSSVGDTASIGAVLIPMMKDDGYDADFATSVTIASSVQGVLIPPSHNMVIYALVAGGVSVGQLFLAGIIPGVLLGVALMIFSYAVAVKRGYPKGETTSLKQALKTIIDSVLGLVTVLIVVFGVVLGVFTATEAAAIAVAYAFFITFFVYREIPLSQMNSILSNALKTLSIVLILIGTSSSFGWFLSYLQVPQVMANVILGISENKIIVMLILNLLLLFIGTFMDMSALILLGTPIFLPIAMSVGVDPVHFGVVMMLNLGIGLLTPPVGGTLFVGSAIGGVSIERLSKTMLPFYLVMVIVLLVITYIPDVVLFIPRLFY